MNILAFDTCFGAVSVAVRSQGEAGTASLVERSEERDQGHAERLMPLVSEAMAAAGLAFSDIGRIAITLGPGTFTGVRTGLAAARAFALATGADVVGMPTLAVMALRADELEPGIRGRPLAVAVDARRGQVYLQAFAAGDRLALCAPELLDLEAAAARVRDLEPGAAEGMLLAGSGGPLLAAIMAGQSAVPESRLSRLEPHAASLAGVAHTLAPLHPVLPIYIRPPDAKPQAGKSLPRRA